MRRRLLLVTLATTSLVVVAFALPLALLVRSVAVDRATTAAERDSAALAPILAVTRDRSLVASAIDRTTTGAAGRLTVWLPDRTQLGDATPADEALALARNRQTSFSQRRDDVLELYSPVVTAAGEVSVVRARVPDELATDGVPRSWLALGGVALFLVLVAVVLADRLARRLTTDAGELAATASSLARGDAAARATSSDTPELAQAAQALNLLADRIDELRSAERERVADLSHRLRTPLTVLRLEAELSGSPALVADVDRMEQAVTEVVAEARRPLHESPVPAVCDLTAVVTERATFWGALAEDDDRRWRLDLDPSRHVPVHLSPAEATAALDVVLGNVFAHTPAGTSYSIGLRIEGRRALLAVSDSGSGIADPSDALTRGVTGADSTGLGLDIARRAAEHAGGQLRIEPVEPSGTRVLWELPLAE